MAGYPGTRYGRVKPSRAEIPAHDFLVIGWHLRPEFDGKQPIRSVLILVQAL